MTEKQQVENIMAVNEPNLLALGAAAIGGIAKEINELLTTTRARRKQTWQMILLRIVGKGFVAMFVGGLAASFAQIHYPEYVIICASAGGWIGPPVIVFGWDLVQAAISRGAVRIKEREEP